MTITDDATVTSKGQVTIPKRIRDALGLTEGSEIEFVLEDDGSLSVRPREPAMDRLRRVQESLSEYDVDLEAMREESKRAWRSHDGEESV